MSQTNSIKHVGGSVFIGSPVSGGSITHSNMSQASIGEVLDLLEELRESAHLLPSDNSQVDLIDTHTRAIEESVRAGEPATAAKRLPPLRKAAQEILDYSPRVIDLVEHVGRLLGA